MYIYICIYIYIYIYMYIYVIYICTHIPWFSILVSGIQGIAKDHQTWFKNCWLVSVVFLDGWSLIQNLVMANMVLKNPCWPWNQSCFPNQGLIGVDPWTSDSGYGSRGVSESLWPWNQRVLQTKGWLELKLGLVTSVFLVQFSQVRAIYHWDDMVLLQPFPNLCYWFIGFSEFTLFFKKNIFSGCGFYPLGMLMFDDFQRKPSKRKLEVGIHLFFFELHWDFFFVIWNSSSNSSDQWPAIPGEDAPSFHLMSQHGCAENDPNGPVARFCDIQWWDGGSGMTGGFLRHGVPLFIIHFGLGFSIGFSI